MKFKNTTRSTSRLSRGYVARFEPASRAPAVPACRPSSDLFFSHQIHQYSPHRGQNTHVFDQFHLRPPYHPILLSFSTTSIRNTSSFVYAPSHTYAFPHPHHSPHKHAKRSPSRIHAFPSNFLPRRRTSTTTSNTFAIQCTIQPSPSFQHSPTHS